MIHCSHLGTATPISSSSSSSSHPRTVTAADGRATTAALWRPHDPKSTSITSMQQSSNSALSSSQTRSKPSHPLQPDCLYVPERLNQQTRHQPQPAHHHCVATRSLGGPCASPEVCLQLCCTALTPCSAAFIFLHPSYTFLAAPSPHCVPTLPSVLLCAAGRRLPRSIPLGPPRSGPLPLVGSALILLMSCCWELRRGALQDWRCWTMSA